jgi:hypothetical protein
VQTRPAPDQPDEAQLAQRVKGSGGIFAEHRGEQFLVEDPDQGRRLEQLPHGPVGDLAGHAADQRPGH